MPRPDRPLRFSLALACLLWVQLFPTAHGEQCRVIAQVREKLASPQAATVLIDSVDARAFVTHLAPGSTAEIIDLVGAPFAAGRPHPACSSLKISVHEAVQPAHRVQVLSDAATSRVRKGDTLLASFWVRALDNPPGAGGLVSMRLQLNQAPWTSPLGAEAAFETEWKQVFASGVADRDYEAGDLRIAFHLGHQRQVIELAGAVVLNLGPGVALATLPRTRLTWPGMAEDAPWRAEARRRIETYRMGDLVVRVRDATGSPASGVTVRVRQQRREFTIGSFVQFANPTRVLTESVDGERSREIFQRLFNRATCPIYWADWGWPGRRDEFLAIGDWLRRQDMVVRGHVMIYPAFNFMPAELSRLQNDPPGLQARILEQIREVAAATRPLGFREYDVTNELRDCEDLHRLLGRQAVAAWFAEARRLLPGAKMALNENSILTQGGATARNQDIYLDWYHYLNTQGEAPDVLGFQAHFGETFTPVETVWAILDRFARETTAELQITEFDIDTADEEAQAAYTRDFLTACFAHPRVTGFTMWGFWEGDHWRPRAAAWRKDWQPKPNAKVLEELLTRTWWTDASVVTDAQGLATFKVFLGHHEVTATLPGIELRTRAHLTDPAATTPLELKP